MRLPALGLALWMTAAVGTACAHPQKSATPTPPLPTPPPPRTTADAKGPTEFSGAVQAYVSLHRRLAAALPKLPDRTEPVLLRMPQLPKAVP